jgi:hypothetical protein
MNSVASRVEGKNFNGTEDHSLIKNNCKSLPTSSLENCCSENCGNLNTLNREVYAPTVVISAPKVCTNSMQINRWKLVFFFCRKFSS